MWYLELVVVIAALVSTSITILTVQSMNTITVPVKTEEKVHWEGDII